MSRDGSLDSVDSAGETGSTDGGGADLRAELAVIERFRARFERGALRAGRGPGGAPPGEVWIGDDAAVVAIESGPSGRRVGPVVVACDLVVEGVHVDLGRCGLDDVGAKSVAVTFSDLAAMGAWPTHLLASVAAPPGTDLDRVAEGMAIVAEAAGCVVVGGDLSSAPVLLISTAALGTFRGDAGKGPLLRSGARPGDAVLVTGPLGRSEAGRRELDAGGIGSDGTVATAEVVADLVGAHLRPVPRLLEGETARFAGASAAIDVSDGLSTDLRHLATASGVGVRLDALPVAAGATSEEAISGGEDYELVLTGQDPDRLGEAFESAGLRRPIPVGRCTGTTGELTLEGRSLPESGWVHRF